MKNKTLLEEVARMQGLAGLTAVGSFGAPYQLDEADPAPMAGDVKTLAGAQKSATSVQSKAKNINNMTEFGEAFRLWFDSLGLEPGKGGATTQAIRTAVEKVAKEKGF